jgi:tripartite ATP-independent transporter DctM subunit
MAWWLLVAGLLATIGSGASLGAALGLVGWLLLYIFGGNATQVAVNAVWNLLNDFTLTAIPLFILIGDLLLESRLSTRVYGAMSSMFGRVPGRLLHTNIAVCTIFGAVSGSSMSVAAAVGSVAYPELAKRGYDRPTVVGTLAAGGTLGLLIPPSLSLLIYGALTSTSVGQLFMAGVVPGLALSLLFMTIVFVLCRRNPELAPAEPNAPGLGAFLRNVWNIWPVAVLIVAVLGSIAGGFATPTEAAGVGAATALVLGFAFGELTWRRVWRCVISTTGTFATVGMVIVGAVILAQALSVLGMPRQLVGLLQVVHLSKYEIFALIVIVYLILGCFFEGMSMMIMTLPIVFPLATGLGFDPVWFGVIVTIMIEVALLTPPVGLNLFVLTAITNNEVNLAQAARAALPFWIAMLAFVAVLALFPQIVLFLPRLFF